MGFFDKKDTESLKYGSNKSLSCIKCGLPKGCKNPKLKPTGNFKKKILNIAPFPSRLSDSKGKAFQGSEYKYLASVYKKYGIDLYEDCLNTYAINCYTNKKASQFQLECCRKSLLKLIKDKEPHIIVSMGLEPLISLIEHRWKKRFGTLQKWQGWTIPDQDLKSWIIPTFDMDFLDNDKKRMEKLFFEKDIQKVKQLLKKPFPVYQKPILIDISKDLSPLNDLKDCEIAFDYEATGLKPHAKGQRIKCASVAYSSNEAYVFEMPLRPKDRKPFLELLKRKSVGKIAQNLKYEDNWSNVRLRTPVINWIWDTMLNSHIIDNRKGVTDLKFQNYVQFGIIDYDSEVSPYLKAKGSNELNKLEQLMKTKKGKSLVLQYCGEDSIATFRLKKLQEKIINKQQPIGSKFGSHVVEAHQLFLEGIQELAYAERIGLQIDIGYVKKTFKKIDTQIEEIESTFFKSKFYRHWKHTLGGKKPNLNSDDQLSNYLYNVKKINPPIRTATGKGSVNEESLKLLKIPELDLLIKRSKLFKIKNYLKDFNEEQVKETMHPNFNLHLVTTYRSSSDSPNFQNIPKRDKESMRIVRQAIYPRKGHQFLEMDYSGIEVAIAACYHKDPNMIKYITDPKSDMHGDMAKQIFRIKDWDKKRSDHSTIRAATKNGFVFPQFYGDWYESCAINIACGWMGLPQGKWKKGTGFEMENGSFISDHLIKSGFTSISDFTRHIQKIEKHFWNKRFPVYNQWKQDWYDMYLKHGYVPFKTGFVVSGIMSRKDVINYPIQGAAFHCLLWTFKEVSKALKRANYKSRLVGQIHDALVFDIYPKEVEKVYMLVNHIGTVLIKKAFPWIIVPLELEAELCPIDGSWAEKKDWNPNLTNDELEAFKNYFKKVF